MCSAPAPLSAGWNICCSPSVSWRTCARNATTRLGHSMFASLSAVFRCGRFASQSKQSFCSSACSCGVDSGTDAASHAAAAAASPSTNAGPAARATRATSTTAEFHTARDARDATAGRGDRRAAAPACGDAARAVPAPCAMGAAGGGRASRWLVGYHVVCFARMLMAQRRNAALVRGARSTRRSLCTRACKARQVRVAAPQGLHCHRRAHVAPNGAWPWNSRAVACATRGRCEAVTAVAQRRLICVELRSYFQVKNARRCKGQCSVDYCTCRVVPAVGQPSTPCVCFGTNVLGIRPP